jgi:hypothetical protein
MSNVLLGFCEMGYSLRRGAPLLAQLPVELSLSKAGMLTHA